MRALKTTSLSIFGLTHYRIIRYQICPHTASEKRLLSVKVTQYSAVKYKFIAYTEWSFYDL